MTESNYTYTTEVDLSAHEADTTAEDAPTVAWVEQQLDQAEQGNFVYTLTLNLEGDAPIDTAQLAQLVDAASTGAQEPSEAAAVPPTRDEIREKIFSRLRRPDGTPYAAGYVSGPAARLPMYATEQTEAGAWRAGPARQHSDFRTTKYEDREGIEDRAVRPDEDHEHGAMPMLDEDGDPVDGTFGWVMDHETGYVLLFDESDNDWFTPDGQPYTRGYGETWQELWQRGYKVRQIHHTTPVAGMPVTGAGIIVVEHGTIRQITDESGHYRPDSAQQHAAIQALVDEGYSLEDATIKLTGRSMGERPTDKAGWLDQAAATNPDFPTGDVTLRSDQFLQTEGDEYQIRMKQALNAQINEQGERPGTQSSEGWGKVEPSPYSSADDLSGGDDSLSDDDSVDDDAGSGIPQVGEVFVDEYGRRMKIVADPNKPGYQTTVEVHDDEPEPDLSDSSSISSDSSSTSGSESGSIQQTYVGTLDDALAARDDTGDGDGDSAAEETPEQTNADFVAGARDYLAGAGRSEFAKWFRTLGTDYQTLLLADPEIGAAWREENLQATPAWQPAEGDHVAAAQTNAAFVDALDDRASAPFTVAGFALVIGNRHAPQLQQFVAGAPDAASGTVTVRKAGLGRGSGSLTFTGVPAAKQEIVRSAVARFSRKEVRFDR